MNFDAIVQRLQNLAPFNVYQITPDGTMAPWYEVPGEIIKDVVIHAEGLATQVQVVAGQVAHWGRITAQAKRVWEAEERKYRVWKARQYLESVDPKRKPNGWKKPTEKAIEAGYRLHPDYEALQLAIERAEEAYNSAQTLLDAFKAKQFALTSAVKRNADGSVTLSV